MTLYQEQGLYLVPFCEGAELEAFAFLSFSLLPPQSPLLAPSLSLLGPAIFSVHTALPDDITRFMPSISVMNTSSHTSPRSQTRMPKGSLDVSTMVVKGNLDLTNTN